MVKARINQTGGVKANINSSTSSGPQQVSVQVPSTNVSITNVNRLRGLSDVDSSSLSDGVYYNMTLPLINLKQETS